MSSATSLSSVEEIESIEQDDSLHDFGGSHGSKGHDFAHFWLIVRALEVEKSGSEDYMFLCEYVQDIAEFNSSASPSEVVLYQLKKKEDGYWKTSDLTGQSLKDKAPKDVKPLPKLFKGVLAFKSMKAHGVFVSNAKFDVNLSSAESSVNETSISLADWEASHAAALKSGLGAMYGVASADVDLSALELRRVALHVDDLQRHTYGVMLEFLQSEAPEHIEQASSLVDTLYVRIKATARRTDKCKSWGELVSQRGFGRSAFRTAVESLAATPDRAAMRQKLLNKLEQDWTIRKSARVLSAMTRCAREKVLLGTANRWTIAEGVVDAICEHAQENNHSDQECFKSLVTALLVQMPEASEDEISALAIYEMSEWNLNQTPV